MYQIRSAEPKDIPALTDIYNRCLQLPYCTADTEIQSVEKRTTWFHEHKADTHPIFIIEADDNILGYAYISPYRSGRRALSATVELSYYIHPDYFRLGLASQLIRHSLDFCLGKKYKNIIAIILEFNTASIGLMKAFGFSQWGFLPKVAEFNENECGHVYYGKRIIE